MYIGVSSYAEQNHASISHTAPDDCKRTLENNIIDIFERTKLVFNKKQEQSHLWASTCAKDCNAMGHKKIYLCEARKSLTKFGYNLYHKQFDLLNNYNVERSDDYCLIYHTNASNKIYNLKNGQKCYCSFRFAYGMICRHEMARNYHLDVPLFCINDVADRFKFVLQLDSNLRCQENIEPSNSGTECGNEHGNVTAADNASLMEEYSGDMCGEDLNSAIDEKQSTIEEDLYGNNNNSIEIVETLEDVDDSAIVNTIHCNKASSTDNDYDIEDDNCEERIPDIGISNRKVNYHKLLDVSREIVAVSSSLDNSVQNIVFTTLTHMQDILTRRDFGSIRYKETAISIFSEQLKLATQSSYNKESQSHLVNKTKVAVGRPNTIRLGNPKSSTARRKKCCSFCHLSGHTRANCSVISKYGQCLSVRVQSTEIAEIIQEKYVKGKKECPTVCDENTITKAPIQAKRIQIVGHKEIDKKDFLLCTCIDRCGNILTITEGNCTSSYENIFIEYHSIITNLSKQFDFVLFKY